MSKLSYLEKLLDGAEVEWLPLKNLTADRFWIMPATPNFNEQEDVPYITSKISVVGIYTLIRSNLYLN